jgi:hypothetical protein
MHPDLISMGHHGQWVDQMEAEGMVIASSFASPLCSAHPPQKRV